MQEMNGPNIPFSLEEIEEKIAGHKKRIKEFEETRFYWPVRNEEESLIRILKAWRRILKKV